MPTIIGTYGTPVTQSNTILVQSGNEQSAVVGTELGTPLSVIVSDSSGQPVSGALIDWSVNSGGGSFSLESSSTNASGIEPSVNYTLGTLAGANTLVATLAGSSTLVAFNETGIAGPAQAASSTVIAAQSSVPADGTGDVITVTLKDQYGNPVSGKTVTLAGSPSTGTTISAASGSSSASGAVTFTVSSTDSETVVFGPRTQPMASPLFPLPRA